jgi:hypothetical protein
VPIPKRSASPRPDVDTAVVVSLKVLDPNRPILCEDRLRAFWDLTALGIALPPLKRAMRTAYFQCMECLNVLVCPQGS